jgi:TusA-related sulfurtransferase
MVISDKESMLNDIPSVCSLVDTKLLNTIKFNGLYIFFIQNKKWASVLA